MLILKCTQKAANALGVTRGNLCQIPPEENATILGDWFVNELKFGRTKTLLFTNASTLYSILVEYRKKEIADIGHFFKVNLKIHLLLEGIDNETIARIYSEYDEVTLAKTDSRSVLGSMNDLAWLYEGYIEGDGGIKAANMGQVVRKINRTPQLKRDGQYSIIMLRKKLGLST